MTPELEVRLFGARVGWLSAVKGQLSFRYDSAWLSGAQARPLSVSLPLRAEPFEHTDARAYFAGLLPEGHMRELLARQFHVSKQNDYALLEQIGGECAGAVSLHMAEGDAVQASSANDVLWFSADSLAAAIDELPRRPLLAGTEGVRLSLAGAQEKFAVVVDHDRIGLPRGSTPSTHLLKPAIRGFEGSVANEAFCMSLAATMALPTAAVGMREVQGRAYLLVARYDRVRDAAGSLTRLHQEDFCQALGMAPELKYQNEGGPGLKDCFELVRRVTRPNAPSVLRLLDMIIFNALIGNHDAHAKNFSLLYRQKLPELAPLYDCLSTAVYEQLTQKMAMKIGSKYLFNDLWPRHWEQLANACGLSPSQARKRVVALAATLPVVAQTLSTQIEQGFADRSIVRRIVDLINARCAQTLRRMTMMSASDPSVNG